MRKLIIGLVTVLLWIPLASNALGLGSVRVHSALNQALDAEIELLSVSEDEIESVSVTLASYETFARVGIDRPSVLMFLRFNVAKNSSGKHVIKITSREAIREPFLDFIIEVNWRSGRVLREYTILLDPPDLKKQLTRSTRSPEAAFSPQTADNKINRSPENDYNPSMAPNRSRNNSAASSDSGELMYGPVREGDTLWNVATRLRPNKSVSVFQVMKALHEENPDAFIQNNINRLRKGSVLKIDDPAIIAAISREEARREITHLSRLKTDRSMPSADIRSMASTVSPDVIGMDVATASRPNLKLVTPAEGDTKSKPAISTDGVSDEALRNELMLALEQSETQRQENAELKTRMQELQKQLDALQRLITLKDNDLAQLQSQMGGVKEVEVATTTESKQVETGEKAPEVKAVEPAEMSEAKTEQKSVATEPQAAEGSTEKPQQTQAAKSDVDKPSQTLKPLPKVVPPPPVQPSFIESLLSNQSILIGGASLLILLLLLAVVIMRRRKKGFQESILSGGTSSMMNTKGEENNSSNTSFLSDLAISGIGPGGFPSDDGDVDPLTEADVYMAYGRNQQAEELLKIAIAAKPERLDYSHKLLEVYFNTKNREKFEGHVNDTAEALQADETMWNKIVAMGHQIAPENPLFINAPDGVDIPTMGQTGEDPDSMSGNVLDIGLDLDELSAEMEMDDDEMDFDLGLDFSELDDILGDSGSSDNSFDFSMDSDKSKDDKSDASVESSTEDDVENLDTDIDDNDLDLDGGLDLNEDDSSDDLGGFEFDLDDNDSESAVEKDDNQVTDDLSLELDDEQGVDAFSIDDENIEMDDFDLSSEDLVIDDNSESAEEASDELSLDLEQNDSDGFDFDLSIDDEEPELESELSIDEGEAELESELSMAENQDDSLEIDDSATESLDLNSTDIGLDVSDTEQDLSDELELQDEMSSDNEIESNNYSQHALDEEAENIVQNSSDDEFEDDIELDDMDDELLPELGSIDDIEFELDSAIAEIGQAETVSADVVTTDEEALSLSVGDSEEDLNFEMSTQQTDVLSDEGFNAISDDEEEALSSLNEDLEISLDMEEELPEKDITNSEEQIDNELEMSFESDEQNEIATIDDAIDNELSLEGPADDIELEAFADTIDESSVEKGSATEEFSLADLAIDDEDSSDLDDFSFDTSEIDSDLTEEPSDSADISIEALEVDEADEDLYAELENSIDITTTGDDDDLNIELDSLIEEDVDTDDLDSFSFDEDTSDEEINFDFNSDSDHDDVSLDEDDLDFANALNDLESFTSTDEDDLDLNDDLDSELISVDDEIGTKLDLARAYIDMGDAESAQGMLNEVVANGDDEQKQQAQALLNDIK